MLLILSLIDYHIITGFYAVLYMINLVLLVLVKTNGVTINHAKRWLDLGFMKFSTLRINKNHIDFICCKAFHNATLQD